MDFRFSAEGERWRQEIRDFLKEEWWSEKVQAQRADLEREELYESGMEFARKLVEKGWLCGGWPKEYGGQGWSFEQQIIYNEEMAYAGAARGDRPTRLAPGHRQRQLHDRGQYRLLGWLAGGSAVPGWRPSETLRNSALSLPSGSLRSGFCSAASIGHRPSSALAVTWSSTRVWPTPARAGAWRHP